MPKFVNKDENIILNLNYSSEESFTGMYWIDGKKIYEKTINIGTLPNKDNSGVKNVAHGINQLDRVIDIRGIAVSGTETIPLPHNNPWVLGETVTIRVSGANITVDTNSNKSSYTGYVTLKYTKK